tara:strand:+ start:1833 stop:2072 length:240 start_codon:yes stop_codon:yes gene_type:complete
MRYIIIIFTILSLNVYAEPLSDDEIIYFNFIDLNNDEKISLDEVNQITKILFQILDKNNDKIITKEEISNLKNIIESFS